MPSQPLDVSTNEGTMDVILVPDAKSNTATWAIRSSQWLDVFVRLNKKLNIIEAPNTLYAKLDNQGEWITDAQEKLLAVINRSRDWDTFQARSKPLFFMAHGLGGVIVKATLVKIAWVESEFDHIENVICGVVLLGCPHKAKHPDQLATEFARLFSHSSRPSNKVLRLFKKHEQELRAIAEYFEETSLQDLKLLTVRECGYDVEQPGRSLLMNKVRKPLLDPDTTRLHMIQERVVDLCVPHEKLHQLTAAPNELNHSIATWIEGMALEAHEEVLQRVKKADRLSPVSSDAPASTGMNSAYGLSLPLRSQTLRPNSSISNQQGSSTGDFEVIPLDVGLQVPRPRPDLPCFSVEESLHNKDFFAREDILEKLDDFLLPQLATRSETTIDTTTLNRCVALLGLPGVGKSEVAAAFAYSRRTHFDAVFWIQADSKKKLEDGFVGIAQKLKLSNCNEEGIFDPAAALEQAKGWLSNPKKVVNADQDLMAQTDATSLLVLDNADEPSILMDYWPIFGPGSVLLTSKRSRLSFVTELNPWPVHIEELEPFSIDEGAELIRKWTNSYGPTHVERSRKISQIFGGVPLALLQCAQLVKSGVINFDLFLGWHNEQTQRGDLINEFEAQGSRMPGGATLATRWAMRTMNPSTKAVLDVFSLLDPDRIQDRICFQALDHLESSLLLQDLPVLFRHFIPVRKELMGQPFVKFDNTEKQEWRIHRSVQEVFRFYMDQSRLQHVVTCTIALLHNVWEPEYSKGRSHSVSRWQVYNELYDHLVSVTSVYVGAFESGLLNPDLQLATLLFQCSWVLKEQGQFVRARTLLEVGESICDKMGSNDQALLTLTHIRHTIASIAMETNDHFAALRFTDQVLEYWSNQSRISGTKDRNLAVAKLQYAIALLLGDTCHEAVKELLDGISIMTTVVGDDKEKMSTWFLNLGYAYLLLGQLDDAESTLKHGLAERVKKFGPNDLYSYKSGAYHHALGNVSLCRVSRYYRKRKDWKEAEKYLRDALRVYNLNPEFYIPEIARSTYCLHLVLQCNNGNQAEIESLLNETYCLTRQDSEHDGIEMSSIRESDLDNQVNYSSR
ncbi:unnamed protein product [Alternaria alternata]